MMTIDPGSSVVRLSSQRMQQLGVLGPRTRLTSSWPTALLLLAVLARIEAHNLLKIILACVAEANT